MSTNGGVATDQSGPRLGVEVKITMRRGLPIRQSRSNNFDGDLRPENDPEVRSRVLQSRGQDPPTSGSADANPSDPARRVRGDRSGSHRPDGRSGEATWSVTTVAGRAGPGTSSPPVADASSGGQRSPRPAGVVGGDPTRRPVHDGWLPADRDARTNRRDPFWRRRSDTWTNPPWTAGGPPSSPTGRAPAPRQPGPARCPEAVT